MSDKPKDAFHPDNNPMNKDQTPPTPRQRSIRKAAEYGQSEEVRLILVNPDQAPNFVKTSQESRQDDKGNWRNVNITNIYINESGDPMEIWPDHPKAWISHTGLYIFDESQRGVCGSFFHKKTNFNVKKGVDGDIYNDQCRCDDCNEKHNSMIGIVFLVLVVVAVIGYLSV